MISQSITKRVLGRSLIISPYVGQVATRCHIPNVQSGVTNSIMSRTAHVASDSITSLQLRFPGYRVTAGAETGTTSVTTFTASIEYPANTFTQVKWASSTSTTAVVSGMTPLSDSVSVNIPNGSTFWVRNFAATAGGTGGGLVSTQMTALSTIRWSAGGDASIFTNAVGTDTTMSGTITHGGIDAFIFPLCIVSTTINPSFILYGDSRTIGAGMDPDSNGNCGQLTVPLGVKYGYINAGVSGDQLRQFNASCVNRRQLAQYCSHVINAYGRNDADSTLGNRAGSAILQDAILFGKLFANKPLIAATVTGKTTSTDSWATVANQTLTANEVAGTQAFNNLIRSTPLPYKHVLDIAYAQEDISNTGKWKAPGRTTDGLHATATGYNDITTSSVVIGDYMASIPPMPQWTPYSISSNACWADISNGAIANTAGTPLNNFAEPTGSGWIFSNTAPTYSATAFNGGPGYTFNGTNQGMVGNAAYKALTANLSGITLVLLFQLTSNPSTSRGVFGVCATATTAERGFISIDSSGHLGISYKRLDADSVSTAFSSSVTPLNAPTLVVAVFDPVNNTAYLRANGVQVASGSFASAGAFTSTAAIALGLGTLGTFTAMVAREVDFFPLAVTASNILKLEGDCAWRHNLASSVLPTTHAYYPTAPTS
jgi:lysophospholipase L1-like esterase